MNDIHAPNAILLEYLEDTEELNCVNYSGDRLQAAIVGLREIHSALIHHRDVYPKNILIVRGPPERVVWIDFDVAMTFDSTKPMGYQADEHCDFEIELVKSFGRLLWKSISGSRLTAALSSLNISPHSIFKKNLYS
ncbi:unnamed protein product [Aspergillus oryzae RIB40]|uniref:DNA, SC005 n=2 Tax=Aspergillus oryzae TaxID=5062 RepID=Q2US37_ASPOR|nr:unnamed protein product [Aspergillus oryzae RIB40]EIT73965.1 hypothetical protein Ao3042_10045 [Aspergillus oryzae 3.042]BAE55628.1 unnamed protein product [Aspergillus oryzae RIB40]|eukprot:EIT73965.1 hypothetical protein Ao3042_10045 [Aspergillus oryzae 3.042]